jgi:hypothetical protein
VKEVLTLRRKKVPIIIFTIASVVLSLSVIKQGFMPRKIIDDMNNTHSISVVYHGTEIPVDGKELIKILNKYDAKKRYQKYFPYERHSREGENCGELF